MALDESLRADVTCLVEAAQQLCAARDIGTVTEIVRRSARKLTGADGSTFVLREGSLVFYADEDSISPLWRGQRFPASACISGWAMQHRQSVVIEDVYTDARIPQDLYRPTFVRSMAMVPVNREDPIAAIGVYWAKPHVASSRELELIQALADAAATAVANSELYRGLLAARAELEHTTARLRLALEAGAVGTWDWDLTANVLSWDEKTKALFALPSDAAVDYALFLSRTHPDDRASVQAAVEAAIAGGDAGRFDIEYRTVPAADGSVHWISACGRALFDANRAIRFVGTVRDITSQKFAEAEKAELLNEANAANRAKDEFLAMLGHELRNPLAPIVTALELLKLRGHEGSREVATIERQSQHLVRLVDDLLDIARITRGQLELKRERVTPETFITKAIEIAAPLIEQRRHSLDVVLAPNTLIDGDETRLSQVFANLLNNAAKYTTDGGKLRIESKTRDQRIEIAVHDSGCGIAPELLPRLFAPFVQASQTSERAQGGLGLGLALASAIVELHGGTIRAESAGRDQGSVFTVSLPEASHLPQAKAAPSSPVQPTASGPKRRVLIVDDNEDAAELLAILLRSYGHEVTTALDPVEALEAVRHVSPDVAFLDIGLPVMDGYELAAHLQKELGARCPVLVAVTGYGQQRDHERSRAAGFALHLVKPVQQTSVLDALKQLGPRELDRTTSSV